MIYDFYYKHRKLLIIILLVILPSVILGLINTAAPILACGLILMVASILFVMMHPKVGLICFSLFLIFQYIIVYLIGGNYGALLDKFDEIYIGLFFIIIIVTRLINGEKLRFQPVGYFFISLTIIGFLSSYLSNLTNISAIIGQFLLTAKGLIVFYTFYNIDYQESDITVLFKYVNIVGIFITITVLFNIAFPETFTNAVGGVKYYRMGFINPVSVFGHPGGLGNFMSLILCFPIALYLSSKNKYNNLITVIIFILVMMSTMRVMSVFALTVTLLIILFYVNSAERKRVTALLLLLIIPGIAFVSDMMVKVLGSYFIKYDPSKIARNVLYLTSFKISEDYFPFGSGFGTFGGWMSRVYYSPLYYKYGLNTVWGLSPKYGSFINDTFWPHILAELGIFGFIMYAMIFVVFIKYSIKGMNNFYSPIMRCFSLVCFMIVISSLVLSIKATIYEMSLFAYIIFGSLGILCSCMRNKKYIIERRVKF